MVTAFYLAVLAILYFGLTFHVIYHRRTQLISLGDGGYRPLRKAIRIHANFAEYTPLLIMMLYFCEVQGLQSGYLHLIGLGYTIGRLFHFIGIMKQRTLIILRQSGMLLTFLAYISLILILLIKNIPLIF